MKRIFVVILTFLIMIASPYKIEAKWPDDSSESIIENLEDSFEEVEEAVKKVPEISNNVQVVSNLSVTFQDAIKICQGASAVLGIINGSYQFLKLIGVVKDPIESKLNNIIAKLDVMDEKLSEMDQKLNNITTEMSKIQASTEFNARTQKAILLQNNWRDFNYRYIEEGLDKLISQYESMGLNGMMRWCLNEQTSDRYLAGIDNNKVIVCYKQNGSNYDLTFSISNSVPSDVDRYIIVDSSALPSSFAWDINNYPDNLQTAIINSIKNAYQNDQSVLEIVNYPNFDPTGNYSLQCLASDIIDTLSYRLTAAQVNNDANFTKEALRVFNNYCTHLTSADEGIDAIYKAYFLTHAFEKQIAEDITNFSNRMIVKTGIYGLFISNVLGMSNVATNADKEGASKNLAETIRILKQGQNNALTGKDQYCYLTNTELWLINIYFEGSAYAQTEETSGNGKISYRSFSASGLKANITQGLREGSYIIGDTNMLLLSYILGSNGVDMTYDYLKEVTHGSFTNNFEKIVTSYGSESQLALDGTIKLYNHNCGGDYFKNITTLSKLPSSASMDYMVLRRKINGSTYDLTTKQLNSGVTLLAYGIYGESHWHWIKDEVSIMWGPTTHPYVYGGVSRSYQGDDDYKYQLSLQANYNTIMCVPLLDQLQTKDGYSPLSSYNILTQQIKAEINKVPSTGVNNCYYLLLTTSVSSLIAIYYVYRRLRKS